MDRSVSHVSQKAKEALSIIGTLALSPFSHRMLAASLTISDRESASVLGELAGYGLLNVSDGRYEVIHALIHTYARNKKTPAQESIKRLADYYISFAKEHGKKGSKGNKLLDLERLHIMKVLEIANQVGCLQSVIDLTFAVCGYFSICGYWFELQKSISAWPVGGKKF